MSDTNFTPGPWVVDFGGTTGHIKSVAKNKSSNTPTVARYDIGIPGVSEDEQYANAHLIAAGPVLYEALREAVKDLVAYQSAARMAFIKGDSRWEGVSELVQPAIDSYLSALAEARGEKS